MELNDVQSYLNGIGLYQGEVDGKYSPLVKVAIEALFLNQGVTNFNGWSKNRRIVAAEQLLVRIEGIEIGKIDGLLGPQSRYAFEVFDARRGGDASIETMAQRRGQEARANEAAGSIAGMAT